MIFISMTGQSAQTAIPDDMLYNNINRLHRWTTPEFINRACLDTPQIVLNDHSTAARGNLFDDCLVDGQQASALLINERGEMRRFDYIDDKWAKLADTGHHAIYGRAEIAMIDSGNDVDLSANRSPRHSFYDKVVSWMEDVYDAWIARDQYVSTRLLLLSFGLVGLIGIRRKFKKS